MDKEKLLEQDKLIAERMERRLAREKKKMERRAKLGILGKLFTFEQHLAERDKKNIGTIEETKGKYGRAGNRIYLYSGKHDRFFLERKFKNATKAKKFMGHYEKATAENKILVRVLPRLWE